MRNPSFRTAARLAAWPLFVSTLVFALTGTARAATVHLARPVGAVESGEAVAIDAMAAASLPRLEPEESVSTMWPVAPGRRISIVLTRHEVYASDALIVSIEGGREVPVPRSRLKFFWGAAGDDLDSRVLVVLDPDKGTLEATSWSGGAIYKLSRDSSFKGIASREGSPSSSDTSLREGYRLSRAEAETADGPAPAWSCKGEDGSLLAPESPVERPPSGKRPDRVAVTAAYTAVVAVDTDNEFMASRGDNNLTVVNYLTNLIATMNTQTYNPDFPPGSVTLVQGYTILRPSTTPDPYTQGPGAPGGANGAELSEFSNYWSANYSYVHRALAMMISGKQPGPNSASGIAWLGSHTSSLLCSTSNGYSFNQVFTNGTFYPTIAQLVAHEIGHNMGAAHTHCEGLDQCYSGEAGCYSGPTSCPAGGGTLMSYCHLLGGCTASAHFHPVQEVYVNSNFQNAADSGVCVFPAITGAPVPVGVAPNSGPMSGGSTVAINGSNFKADARVTVNGVVASVVGTSPTQVTILTPPAAAPAIVNVVVTNHQVPTDLSATLTNVFTYTFNDVPVGNPFFSFVMKMAFDGISSGCGSGNFCVSDPVTRGQMAVFLLRSKDGQSYNPPACTTPLFSDVPCSSGFAPWINELSNRNVTAGCGAGLYCINSPVTRGQMAVFLLRTHDGASYTPPACTVAPFNDVPCGSPYAVWVQELVARGITAGCGSGNFCLNNAVTRGQMAVFLVTTFSLP